MATPGKLSPTEIARLTGTVPKALHNEVMAVIKDCAAKLVTTNLAEQGRLDELPTVSYDLTGRVAGHAQGGRHITLNLALLLNPDTKQQQLEQTLPHEYAHIIQRRIWPSSKAHGPEWKYVMHKLGLRANRTHNMAVQPARKHEHVAEFRCTNCGAVLKMKRNRYNRYLAGSKYYHTDCRSEIEFIRELS